MPDDILQDAITVSIKELAGCENLETDGEKDSLSNDYFEMLIDRKYQCSVTRLTNYTASLSVLFAGHEFIQRIKEHMDDKWEPNW